MACSSCNSGNSLSSCGCVDNCPTKTSEFTFDGIFSSIPVPPGSTLNEVLLLMETFVMNSIGDLNFNYELTSENCLGLPAGTYSYQQMIDAIITLLCSLEPLITAVEDDVAALQDNNILEWIDIVLVNGWIESDSVNNPAQYAIQNGLMYLKGNIKKAEVTSLTNIFWASVPMTGITRVIDTMCYENYSTIGAAPIRVEAGDMSYEGPVDANVVLFLDSIPVIRLTN
jgi:hypothetical protein